MSKQYRIHVRGPQRDQPDADLMAQLVVMLGRQLAEDARGAIEANREAERTASERPQETDDGRGKRR